MAVRFFVVNDPFEAGLYKAPKQMTARIVNASEGSNVDIFDSFEEAQEAASALFDRLIYERRRMGLSTDEIERFLLKLEDFGEAAVPTYHA